VKLTVKDISELIRYIKSDIEDDMIDIFSDDNIPSIQITIASNRKDLLTGNKNIEWDYQTGDNSYHGSCYFYDTWAVEWIYRRSNSRELAKNLIDQLYDQAYQ
jgi:hypothetical protein